MKIELQYMVLSLSLTHTRTHISSLLLHKIYHDSLQGLFTKRSLQAIQMVCRIQYDLTSRFGFRLFRPIRDQLIDLRSIWLSASSANSADVGISTGWKGADMDEELSQLIRNEIRKKSYSTVIIRVPYIQPRTLLTVVLHNLSIVELTIIVS